MNERQIRERVRCSACGQRIGRRINLLMLPLRATWRLPVHGNVLTGATGGATAIVCDACIDADNKPREAVEFSGERGDEVIYHPVESLDPLPPEKTYVIRGLNNRRPSIECLRCGNVSYNPEDVRNKYCDACEQFHEEHGEDRS